VNASFAIALIYCCRPVHRRSVRLEGYGYGSLISSLLPRMLRGTETTLKRRYKSAAAERWTNGDSLRNYIATLNKLITWLQFQTSSSVDVWKSDADSHRNSSNNTRLQLQVDVKPPMGSSSTVLLFILWDRPPNKRNW